MNTQEYQKRLATAIQMLGEDAGRRYMEQRLKDLKGEIERRLRREVASRVDGLTSSVPLVLTVEIGPQGVAVRALRRSRKLPEGH